MRGTEKGKSRNRVEGRWPGNRTAAGKASWLEASWCPDEAGEAQTAQPETHCRGKQDHITHIFFTCHLEAVHRVYSQGHRRLKLFHQPKRDFTLHVCFYRLHDYFLLRLMMTQNGRVLNCVVISLQIYVYRKYISYTCSVILATETWRSRRRQGYRVISIMLYE